MRLINLSATAALGLGLLSNAMAVPISNTNSGSNSTVTGASSVGAPLTARAKMQKVPITITFVGGKTEAPSTPEEAEEDKKIIEEFVKEMAQNSMNAESVLIKYMNDLPSSKEIKFNLVAEFPEAEKVCDGKKCVGTIDKLRDRKAIIKSGKGRMIFSLQLAAILSRIGKNPPAGARPRPSSETGIEPAQ
ncbi:hypothetical protein GYMLUDRAFT_243823 [Collybiopsis luxurians FD-317 M1]|uniref:Uncharacterized protein n=1 Tax=Collybiopsis luxurians FD-317 M1 TaxID=944289 RepID=A0A0D0CQ74_9AGAR|nr:hypothetical protein GYMLUDRAFT_243823 [Collybiopsis luxurians FD-317 M1]